MFSVCNVVDCTTYNSYITFDLKSEAETAYHSLERFTSVCSRNDSCEFFRLGVAAGPVAGNKLQAADSCSRGRQSLS